MFSAVLTEKNGQIILDCNGFSIVIDELRIGGFMSMCCVCGKVLGIKEGRKAVSHGYCDKCCEEAIKTFREVVKDDSR